SMEGAGRKLSDDDIKDYKLKVEGDQWLVTAGKEELKITYTVDASKTPKAIDMAYKSTTGEAVTWRGIYKFEGDTLTLCRAIDKRPEEFKAAEKGMALIVWKRAKE